MRSDKPASEFKECHACARSVWWKHCKREATTAYADEDVRKRAGTSQEKADLTPSAQKLVERYTCADCVAEQLQKMPSECVKLIVQGRTEYLDRRSQAFLYAMANVQEMFTFLSFTVGVEAIERQDREAAVPPTQNAPCERAGLTWKFHAERLLDQFSVR